MDRVAEGPEYLLDLDAEAKFRLENNKAKAEVEFRTGYRKIIKAGRKESTLQDIEQLLILYAYSRFFAFAEEAVNSSANTSLVRRFLEHYLRVVILTTFESKHPDARTTERGKYLPEFFERTRFIITNSSGWLELETCLVERSELELQAVQKRRETQTDTPGHVPTAQRALADEFIDKVARSGRKITRTDIWKVAGYKDSTEFLRFQSNSPRCTKAAITNFTRVLAMNPIEFLSLLDEISKRR